MPRNFFLNTEIMPTMMIENNTAQAQRFVEYARTLPFTTIVEEKKKGFREAAQECNAISVKAFTNELRRQIDEHFDSCVQYSSFRLRNL